MDGEKAILLAKSGLLADLQQCGLHKLKSCAKRVQYKSNVQKNNRKFAISPSWDELKPLLARSMAAASSQDGKLKRNEVSALKPEEHRTYLIKLNLFLCTALYWQNWNALWIIILLREIECS